ncbi:jg9141 [Pararge aegeria aegeria]|uniref:Jg9141 protein n=1 Tax=Pararge aegeria aegeria TaxID=348720 RepID=A0A8S4SIY7_9NEOP|nr:jg9141 [Pararge aegeria aegeria]
MGNGMNKVLPGLYVGNYRDSKDPLQLEKYKITHILSIHDAARRIHATVYVAEVALYKQLVPKVLVL